MFLSIIRQQCCWVNSENVGQGCTDPPTWDHDSSPLFGSSVLSRQYQLFHQVCLKHNIVLFQLLWQHIPSRDAGNDNYRKNGLSYKGGAGRRSIVFRLWLDILLRDKTWNVFQPLGEGLEFIHSRSLTPDGGHGEDGCFLWLRRVGIWENVLQNSRFVSRIFQGERYKCTKILEEVEIKWRMKQAASHMISKFE